MTAVWEPEEDFDDTILVLESVRPLIKGRLKTFFQRDEFQPYIQCGEFEELCNACGIHVKDKIDMGRGRLTAALFPEAFCRHLKALVLASKGSRAQDLTQCLENATNSVLEDLPYAKNNVQNEEFQFFDEVYTQNEEFQFFDEVCHGEPVNVDVIFRLGGLIAICQQFSPDSETSIEFCIVQHDLTGAYLCRRAERSAYNEDLVMEGAIGVLGLETTSDDILVENVRDDGSYYLGKLKDFSYQFAPNKTEDSGQAVDNQCAYRLFGHLKGAEFLAGKENGLKCSPLLAIALATATNTKNLELQWKTTIATNTKNLELEWKTTRGHMHTEDLSPEGFGNAKCQILYMDKINQLGSAVEWGMDQLVGVGASSSSPAQPETSYSSLLHREENVQDLTAIFAAAKTDRRTIGVNLTGPGGVGVGGSVEKYGSKGNALAKVAYSQIMKRLYRSSGHFVENDLDTKHTHLKEYLLQGRLSELPNTYLVVGDDVADGHVSVYWADDEHGKYAWVTDIMIPGGKETLFEGGLLKGLRMKVERDSVKLVSIDASRSTSHLFSRFKRHKWQDIIDDNMKYVPQGSHSNDDWVHLIGPQEKFSGNKFLWQATHMRAIISSRTSYSSGASLEMFVLNDKFGDIGYCVRGETDAPLVHLCPKVVAWGQLSKAPASLVSGANPINWGGLVYDDLC